MSRCFNSSYIPIKRRKTVFVSILYQIRKVILLDERTLTGFVGPHAQLLHKLRNHQESLPALTFLWLEDIAKDVIPHIEDVFPPNIQQITDNIRRS